MYTQKTTAEETSRVLCNLFPSSFIMHIARWHSKCSTFSLPQLSFRGFSTHHHWCWLAGPSNISGRAKGGSKESKNDGWEAAMIDKNEKLKYRCREWERERYWTPNIIILFSDHRWYAVALKMSRNSVVTKCKRKFFAIMCQPSAKRCVFGWKLSIFYKNIFLKSTNRRAVIALCPDLTGELTTEGKFLI